VTGPSLEARAQMIADASCRTEFAGNNDARRKTVYGEALKHLREAMGQQTPSTFYGDAFGEHQN
jgi:hypothetical protein